MGPENSSGDIKAVGFRTTGIVNPGSVESLAKYTRARIPSGDVQPSFCTQWEPQKTFEPSNNNIIKLCFTKMGGQIRKSGERVGAWGSVRSLVGTVILAALSCQALSLEDPS